MLAGKHITKVEVPSRAESVDDLSGLFPDRLVSTPESLREYGSKFFLPSVYLPGFLTLDKRFHGIDRLSRVNAGSDGQLLDHLEIYPHRAGKAQSLDEFSNRPLGREFVASEPPPESGGLLSPLLARFGNDLAAEVPERSEALNYRRWNVFVSGQSSADGFPDLEYSFKHALTHEVTYGGLLQERRRALHARIVDAIETLHHDRLGEQIERLAHHAVLGELGEKAVSYLHQAGTKAAARSALQDAQTWFDQTLGVLAALPESPSAFEQGFEIRIELGSVLVRLGEVRRRLERAREAESLAERLNDDGRRGRVCLALINAHTLLGELDEALVAGTRALEIAARLGDLRLRVRATIYLAQVHFFRGDFEQSVELATDTLAVLPADWIHESFPERYSPMALSAYIRLWVIHSLAELGRFAEAALYVAELLPLAGPTQHAYTVGEAYNAASMVHLRKGDWTRARTLIEHSIAALRTGNIAVVLPNMVAASAWVLAQVGEASEALSRLREGEHLFERGSVRGVALTPYHGLGRAALLLGRLDEAQTFGDRAVKSSASRPAIAALALHLLGDVATHPDRFDAATGEGYYRKALALAEPRGMRPLVSHCHLGLGKLYRRTGQREQAHEHLTTATTMYREMDMTYWVGQAEAEMRELA